MLDAHQGFLDKTLKITTDYLYYYTIHYTEKGAININHLINVNSTLKFNYIKFFDICGANYIFLRTQY